MKPITKIILGVGMTIFLVVGLIIVGFVGWLFYLDQQMSSPEVTQMTKKGEADGIEFAKTTDQNGCMEKGFSFESRVNNVDQAVSTFVRSCLKSSKPTPNFCEGVPEFMFVKWVDEQCEKASKYESCVRANLAKRDYCMDKSREK